MKSFLNRIFLVLVIAAGFYGCAAPPPQDLVWPEAPDEPKIKYIGAYRGAGDMQRSNLAADLLLGADGGKALKKPIGIYVDGNGKIFVTDTAASDVYIFDRKNSKMTTLAEMGAKVFYKPIGVTTDATGRIFVSDSQLAKITVLDANGKLLAYLHTDEPIKQPTGMIADNVNKKLYVVDTHSHNIRVFDLDTLKQVKTIGKRGKEEGDFNFPSSISVDKKGNLYVVDTMNGRVQIFDKEGKFIRAFGQFGDGPGMFARPRGVSVDSEGHIYVVDAAFNNVQIFNDEGQTLLAFSSYGNDRGQMILPAGVAIDNDDYIYVVDQWNRRVNIYEYLGDKAKARATAAQQPKKK